jgi:hypothetical protein
MKSTVVPFLIRHAADLPVRWHMGYTYLLASWNLGGAVLGIYSEQIACVEYLSTARYIVHHHACLAKSISNP